MADSGQSHPLSTADPAEDGADDALLEALLTHDTIAAAAQAVGVSPRTVYRRLRDGRFLAHLAAVRGDRIRYYAERAGKEVVASLEALADLRDNGTPGMRFKAAVQLIETVLQLNNECNILPRLANIEAKLENPYAE